MAHLRDLIVNGNSRTFGTAYATKFEGPLTGNATSATKATQDGNGNVITSTYATASSLSSHTGNKSNPHGVTKAQVGLGSVVNIDQSKAIKSITRSGTTFTATALDGSTTTFTQQDSNTTYGIATSTTPGLIKSGGDVTVDASTGTISINDNSHGHSISNISGLQSALDSKLNTSLKGSKNGLATLDSNGFVPSSQLPSYVDDVIDVSMKSDLTSATNASGATITPEAGKIYIDDIGTSATNKTYRWSGTTYVVISETLALGETTSTAFDGARGKVAYNHSQSAHARVDATNTKASTTNGHISINGTDTTVYTHPGYTSHASGLYKVTVDGQGHVSGATAVTKADITALGIPGQDTNTTYTLAGLGGVAKSGDTMSGDLSFTAIGDTGKSAGLSWSGSTDGASIYYQTTAKDQGNLVLNMVDDPDTNIRFDWSGVNKAYISSDGVYHGTATYANSAGSANSVAWNNVSGKPSTYAPSSHTHTIAQITNLQSTLDGKAANSHTHGTIVSIGRHTETASGTAANAPTSGMASTTPGIFMTQSYSDKAAPTTYGNIINVIGEGTGQLMLGWSGGDSTLERLYYRCHRDTSTGGWSNWGTVAYLTDITKSRVGLSNVDNTADANKSVKYATTAGSANAVAWGNITGKPSTYYTHPSYTSHTSGLYKVTVDGSGHVNAATAVTSADIRSLGIAGLTGESTLPSSYTGGDVWKAPS